MTAADHKVDYGPLTSLIGKWVGETGLDVAPDHDCEPCERKFIDELTFVGVGHVSNAGKQSLLAVKYHQLVKHCEDQNVLHDQIGHWLYEPSTGIVMHSLTIPRGVCVLAGGTAKPMVPTLFLMLKPTEATRLLAFCNHPSWTRMHARTVFK